MSAPRDLRPPDDTVAEDELRCPLCGYDLRGLPEHRCPECGHAFDPAELRRAKAMRREWLFEDAAGRWAADAFVRTSLASLRPIWFWSRVTPEHPVVAKRLALWTAQWSLYAAVIVAACGVAGIVVSIRSSMVSAVTGGGYAMYPTRGGYGQTYPSVPSFVDDVAFWFERNHLASPLAAVVGVASWAPVAVMILRIFGSTLRRADIRSRHLWRCVLYAVPSLAIPTVALAAISCCTDVNATSHWEWSQRTTDAMMLWPKATRQFLEIAELSPPAAAILLWAALASTVHLTVAHVRYLRLPHAIAQALLAQAASWLLILTVIAFRTGRV